MFRGFSSFHLTNRAEATMIGVVATTFACSDHNNVTAYCRGPYINVGVFLYALIASLGLGLGVRVGVNREGREVADAPRALHSPCWVLLCVPGAVARS